MAEPHENKLLGRPEMASGEDLFHYEFLWIVTFYHLRNGIPETPTEIHGSSGIYMKQDGQRERLGIILPGRQPRTVEKPKLVTTPGEIRRWQIQERKEHEKFTRLTMGEETTTRAISYPAERELWEGLKRARSCAQVRRIYKRSQLWLKPHCEFPDGGHIEWQPHVRILYKHAERFCRAKLDNRYPSRDERESGDYRRIEYLARAMAGLTLEIAPSTAVEKLRKMKHSEQCRCWRCTNQIAPRFRRSVASFLSELEHSGQA